MQASLRRRLAVALVGTVVLVAGMGPALAEKVTVFAAASTTNAVTDVAAAFTRKTGHTVVPSFASSSTLARQIEQGAPAEVYISANPMWMNYLQDAGLLQPDTRSDVLGNRLALVAPKDAVPDVKLAQGAPLAELLGEDGRLAVGDPAHVPAGMYAEQALRNLGLWEALEPRLARAGDVRAALALVARGEAPLGIVYATDAAVSADVAVAALFPENSHAPITYPAALVKGAAPAAAAFLTFLTSPEARAVFRTYGFEAR